MTDNGLSTASAGHIRDLLECVYADFARPCYISPDPLEYVLRYDRTDDREIVGLIAASLAFGGVGQIGRSVSAVLDLLGEPAQAVRRGSHAGFTKQFAGWRHRWAGPEELADLLSGAGRVIRKWGSLEACMAAHLKPQDDTIVEALGAVVAELHRGSRLTANRLIAVPERGSACKRHNLFLRWMVRRDAVDPGVWQSVSPAKLIVPLDVHMHRIALQLGLTRRKQADLRTALEITQAFRAISPDDPVRYDFALTRLGIRKELDWRELLT